LFGGWIRGERGFAVGVIDAESDDLNRAPSLPLALQARLPGVSVTQGPGFVGSASRVWLRGPSSLLVNEPLLIIDGARTHAAEPNRGFETRGLPSRLEDIDPESIERVEVLRGAAAAAIYGPGSSKGVILVTTKRGRQGPPRWTAFAQSGPVREVTDFPANFGTLGISPTEPEVVVASCPLADQGWGHCTPTVRRSWNPLESASPFRTGWDNGVGMSVAGGTPIVMYRAAGSHDRISGVYANDWGTATNAHASLGVAPTPAIDVRFTGGYRTERVRHPTGNYIELGLLGEAVDDPVRRGYGQESPFQFPAFAVEHGRERQTGQRFTGVLDAVWRPTTGLRATAMLGYDELRTTTEYRERIDLSDPTVPDLPRGFVTVVSRASDRPEARTARLELENTYPYQGGVGRTAIGIEHLRDDDHVASFEGMFADDPGGPGGSSEFELNTDRASTGIYVQQHIGWRFLFVTGSLRADLPTGDVIKHSLTPSLDVSWIAVREGHRDSRWLGDLRLRTAFARGGGHLVETAEDKGSFTDIARSRQTAERSSEVELGLDATLFARRVQTSITAYRASNDRALVRGERSLGGVIVTNDARIRTRGLETAIDARLVHNSRFTWDMGVSLATQDNEVRRLPANAYRYQFEPQLIAAGISIGEYQASPYTYLDANSDGLLAPFEVAIATEELARVGSPFPSWEAGLRTDVSFGEGVRLSAILDRRAGQKLHDIVSGSRCASFDRQCAEQHRPDTPISEQAAAIAGQWRTEAGWVRDASYTKLREVTVAFSLPRRWTGGADRARLTLGGRNLFTWTSYPGLDPEVTSEDREGYLAEGGFIQPPLRAFSARLDLAW
jgi:TonB-dependent SusC/RagA subfamily outer membrane receptor